MEEKRESSRWLRSVAGLALVTAAVAALLLRPAASDPSAAPAPSPAPAAASSPAPVRESLQDVNPGEAPNVSSFEDYSPDSDGVLRLSGSDIDLQGLRAALGTGAVTRVELPDAELSCEEQLALRQDFPDVAFVWPVDVFGHRYLSTDSSISLAGRSDLTCASLLQLREWAALFTDLQAIDLTGCGLPDKELHALDAALPDTDVVWTMQLYGRELSTADEQFDLSGVRLKDKGARLEAALSPQKAAFLEALLGLDGG